MFWKEWAGHYAVRSYDTCHEREYFSIRHAAGLIDVSPLYKYEVCGSDAAAFLAHLTVRDVRKLRQGRVTYLCWCDDDGKVVDDGTVSRLGPAAFRLTSAEPSLGWLLAHAERYDVTVEDSSAGLAALALQGPKSREILNRAADADLDRLKFFAVKRARIAGVDLFISRTGYTGDLGFEIWIPSDGALDVWDAILEAGRPYRVEPSGLDAMDVARVEAGFVMNGVDYFSSNHCMIESRKSTPYEIGLGWTVKLEREPFIGQAALRAEAQRGPAWRFVGLELDWNEYEAVFAEYDLPPQVPAGAWRVPVPVYDGEDRQVGQATSGAWSPTLKRNLALASVRSEWAAIGRRLRIEVTAEYERRRVTATVARTPFFDPPRKRS